MPEATQPTMHPDFPRWYREVDVEENRERLHLRWAGVTSVIPTLDQSSVENLLRIVFEAKGGPTPEALGKFRKAFKDADEFFDMQGNDREVEVLSGIVLAILLEKNDDLSAWSALAITTSALHGNRAQRLPMNLVATAENTVVRIAEKNRERPQLQNIKVELPALNFANAKEKLTTIDAAGIGAAFDAAATSINLTLANMVKKFSNSLETAIDSLTIQDEELNMLWWVLGERSGGVKKTFSEVPEKGRPFVFGAELADATAYLPGPLSIEGLLARAGLKPDQMLTIPDAINACEKSWLESFSVDTSTSPLSQPLHFAIHRKLETGDDTSWISGWAATSDLDATVVYPSLTLGTLFYRERLLSIF